MFKSILLPIDLNEPSSWEKSIPVAIDMAKTYGAQLRVMTVIPDFGKSIVGSYFPAGFSDKALADTMATLEKLVVEVFSTDVNVESIARHGSVYKEVLEVADLVGADLIVLTSHRPARSDYLLGPNAARVVRHAKQSVFVVRA
ncbi:universal stress protein UspA [Rhodobacterales bacterium 52_120_T64]|nr:universal stress protein UspA [Rhodobacterales bacterium 52_120_T64]